MKYPEWANPTKKAFLLNNNIHIWKIEYSDFSGDENALRSALSLEEKKRADKFHFKIDRKRYIVTKALLKIVLSRIMMNEPLDIKFSFNDYGKPYLKNNIHFNISHSANIGLIAVTDIAPIGVDVEEYRQQINSQEVAKRFFSKKEVISFLELTANHRLQGFFNCWTRKEAFIKAMGLGLAMPLKDFDVTLKPGEAAQLENINHSNEEASDWIMKDIPIEGDYAAAFAIKTKSFKNFYWRVDSLV